MSQIFTQGLQTNGQLPVIFQNFSRIFQVNTYKNPGPEKAKYNHWSNHVATFNSYGAIAVTFCHCCNYWQKCLVHNNCQEIVSDINVQEIIIFYLLIFNKKKWIFPELSRTVTSFPIFPGLECKFLIYQDFPGFPGTLETLFIDLTHQLSYKFL